MSDELQANRIYLVRAIRRRTQGNVYNYTYWQCPDCGYHPGGSDGPPEPACQPCGAALYTDDEAQAAHRIKVLATPVGFGFEFYGEPPRVNLAMLALQADAKLSGAVVRPPKVARAGRHKHTTEED